MANYIKSISFTGSNYFDMVHYISRVLVSLNKKVCILDFSNEQLFKYSIPETENNYICYRNIDIYTHISNLEDIKGNEEYDFGLFLVGYNDKFKEIFLGSNYRVVSTDLKRANVIRLRQFLEKTNINNKYDAIKIIWDLVPCKINQKYIDNLLSFNHVNYLREYSYYQQPETLAISLMNQYNDIFKFSKLDKDYKTMLNDLLDQWVGVDKKTLKKAYRLAERGK